MIKVSTTQDFLAMARAGLNNRLNRTINLELVSSMVDDSKVCVLSMLLYGHNMDDTSKPFHHRVKALVPVKGTDEPLELIVDVLDEHFKQLSDARELHELLAK